MASQHSRDAKRRGPPTAPRARVGVLGLTLVLAAWVIACGPADLSPPPGLPGQPVGPLPVGTVPPYEVSLERNPTPVISRVEGLEALGLLERSDERMRDFRRLEVTIRTVDRDDGSERQPPVTETLSPAQFFGQRNNDPLPVITGRVADRTSTRRHGHEMFPAFGPWSGMAVVIGEDEVDGREAWVIWYWSNSLTDAPRLMEVTRMRTEWIEKETHLLLRQVEDTSDPLDTRVRTILEVSYAGGDR